MSMSRVFGLAALLALNGCITVRMAGPAQDICTPAWSREFADRLAAEADGLPADAASREALAQLAELRGALPRC
jgi:hypothetical protein